MVILLVMFLFLSALIQRCRHLWCRTLEPLVQSIFLVKISKSHSYPFFRLLQLKFRIQRESRDKCACPAIRDFDVLVQDLVITLTQNSTDATRFLFCTYMIYNQTQRFNVSKRLRFYDEDSTLLLAFNLIILDL